MTTRARDESPQTSAQLGGLYLVIIVAALFGEVYVRVKGVDVPRWEGSAALSTERSLA